MRPEHPATAAPIPPSNALVGRRLELDAARGLMLVWITLTHLPTAASAYVNQPFGFVSAAEGFIFLSALFTGRIYFRLAEHDGYRAMTHRLWSRTLRLYFYHALLLAFAFMVAVPIAESGNRPGLHNLLDFYFLAGPQRSIIEAFLLIYRPPLLDILPMYIIFLIFTSAALLLARKIGWHPILWTGFSLWALAQFGLRADAYQVAAKVIPAHIPLHEMGAFDLWAWQFLWIAGVWLGVRWAQNNLPIEKWATRAVIPAVVISAACFVLRRAIEHGLELGPAEFLFDKWHLGPMRLIDFAAVATLLIVTQRLWKFLAVGPLVLMGQSSLQVFCVHLLCCFAGLTLLGNASIISGWRQAELLTVTFAAMLLTAKLFSKSEAKHERRPNPDSARSAARKAAPLSYAPTGRESNEAEHRS
jgi:hypothetical protein